MLLELLLSAAFVQDASITVPTPKELVIVGEVTATTALLQARSTGQIVGDDVHPEGHPATVMFELYPESTPPVMCSMGATTGFLMPDAANDFLVRARFDDLLPGRLYRWIAYFQVGAGSISPMATGTFSTLARESESKPLNFVVLNCMNQHYFLNGGQGRPAYEGEDKALGFPGLEAIDELDPAFVIFAGDSVYYDRPAKSPATDAESMRAHWQRLFAQPRMRNLLASTATYWLKDDHDHRFNVSDQIGKKPPSHELGRKIFREQVPIVALDDDESPTWRTVRVSKDLQIWMTEGRDHRSTNSMPDGPEKTMWGIEQRDWLKRTLLESDAAFKVLVSPTPLVGPDDGYKSDNQTNPKGFRNEGEAFHAWLAEHKLNDPSFVVICGDRHWQYHSVHPQGTHEFAVGALIDANARLGRKPGDPKSTDPDAKVKQLYTSEKPSGGFLEVRLETEPTLSMELIFRDEHGVELYRVKRKP